MFGYIYLTKNLVNGRLYVGKHKSEKYDSQYFGSGKILLQAIDKYGIQNFTNEIIYEAKTEEDLNQKEIQYISEYRRKYEKLMYNIAFGGDGGDTFTNKSEKEKNDFIDKMTIINRSRCSSNEFKKNVSRRLTEKYKNLSEREKQSQKIKQSWSNLELRKEQSQRLKEYYKSNKKDQSYLYKGCIFELNGNSIEFESVKSLRKYLKNTYDYKPSYKQLKKIFENSLKGIGFNPYNYKEKYKTLVGMKIYYKQNENVETMGDECSPVGYEIGTYPKCETEIEEIVHVV